MIKKLISGGFLIMALSLFSSCATLGSVTKEANLRFNTYQEKSKSVQTSYGKITFIDEGKGPAILSIHGICGGYDQGFETLEKETEHYRIIAPSRFGYPGTDLPENARIETQCEAYCQLLDSLNLDKVYLLATSAGGTSAIKMALIHPERVSGLILYSSGYPALEPPKKTVKFAGPPAPFCNDFAMWLISPLFKSIMGMPKSVLKTIIPMKNRKAGILFDGKLTNTDAINNPQNYDMSKITVPVLIFHTKDDKLANNLDTVVQWSKKIPQCQIHIFENGGHLMENDGDFISDCLREFVK